MNKKNILSFEHVLNLKTYPIISTNTFIFDMLPISRAKALEKEQEKQRQQQIAEERKKLHMHIVSLIEEDDLDSLREYVPSKMAIDEIVDELLLLLY